MLLWGCNNHLLLADNLLLLIDPLDDAADADKCHRRMMLMVFQIPVDTNTIARNNFCRHNSIRWGTRMMMVDVQHFVLGSMIAARSEEANKGPAI